MTTLQEYHKNLLVSQLLRTNAHVRVIRGWIEIKKYERSYWRKFCRVSEAAQHIKQEA